MQYLTKQLLKDFNDESIKQGRNRNIKEGYIDNLKDNMVYPVTFSMLHNKRYDTFSKMFNFISINV